MSPNRNLTQFEETPKKGGDGKENHNNVQENYEKLKDYYKTLVKEYNTVNSGLIPPKILLLNFKFIRILFLS